MFEVDSDSEVEEESFARRIARSFTSSGKQRTRSASAAPRSRKGNEVARGQLLRARAETLEAGGGGVGLEEKGMTGEERKWSSGSISSNGSSGGGSNSSGSSGGGSGNSSRTSSSNSVSGGGGHPVTLLRRQKSEVFGKMLWSRR